METENSNAEIMLDLFGNPLSPIKDPRGRKSYGKSKENQELVCNLRAGGMTHMEIATVLGCDEKTLRKYYSRELSEGAILVEAQAISVVMHKMRQGNISATKIVLEMSAKRNPSPNVQRGLKPASEILGKKAEANKEANEVSPGWGNLLSDGKPVN